MQPGSLYRVGNRRYVDSQAVYNVASTHEVVALPNGWRILVHGGSVRCAMVEGRPALPGQRGELYELTAGSGIDMKAHRAAWRTQGLVQVAGRFDEWPGKAKAGCGCTKASACSATAGCACRKPHAPHHEEEP